jgi:hypothetical protein
MEHTKHLWRVGLLIVLGMGAFAISRHFLVPDTFGDLGYFRASSLTEHMAQPVVHGAADACASCHQEQQTQHMGGAHKNVGCEVCHAPLTAHVRPGAEGALEKFADMPSTPSETLCLTCHQRLPARPEAFPQVVVTEHLLALEVLAPGEPAPVDTCFLCHAQHSPKVE